MTRFGIILGGLLILFTFCRSALAEGGNLQVRWRSGASIRAVSNPTQTAELIAGLIPRSGTRHVVIQFTGPVGSGRREKLASAGITLLNYLGDHAYFATVSSTGVSRFALSSIATLAGATPVEIPWKLHPLLAAGETPAWAVVATDSKGSPTIGVYVLFYPDVSLDRTGAASVNRHQGVVRARLPSVNGLVIELPMSQIRSLAAEDGVQYIEAALPRMKGLNDSNRALVGADIVQAAPFALDGSGVTVMVYDVGRAATASGFPHPDFGGRLTFGDTAPFAGHSTHVSGTIGGDGSMSAGLYRGMAPGVSLLSYGFQDDGTGIFLYSNPGDLEADYANAIALGADLANNSIGTNTCTNGFPCTITGDYGVTSALIDAIVRGSLGVPFRSIWANGNERSCTACPLEHQNGFHSTAPPATAKNHITVGAVNSNDDTVTSFTSWGPTDDGRIKPDICAPGCQTDLDMGVTSTNSDLNVFGYQVRCGTSMATPTVTGISALLLQDFRAQFPSRPDFLNSTLKILLAHNAVDIGNPGPDYQSGYGSVRIQPTIEFMRLGSLVEDQVDQLQTFTIETIVTAGDPQLKVTLAWDDVPGTPNVSPSLVNDLDLRVFDPSNTQFFPWTLDPANPANPAIRTQADHVNNIEQVIIDAPTPGVYRVEVHGFNVPSGPQTFSLVGTPSLIVAGVVDLLPITANNPDGAQHTLTASVHQGFAPFGPIANTLVTFQVTTGPNVGTMGTAITDMTGTASFAYTDANGPGVDMIRASFADSFGTHFSNIVSNTWIAGQIALSPTTATITECTEHTVTATVTQGAAPFAPIGGALVTFDVISGPNAGAGGNNTTDVNGVATFTYAGSAGPGTDGIRASFIDGTSTQTSNTVNATWIMSPLDCNLNGIADQCEPGGNQDCNANGIPDLCDLAPALSYAPPISLTVDANPVSIVAAELNGLPGIDLVTGNNGTSSVSVLLSNGDGTFAPVVNYATDKNTASVAVADLNGDGNLDLAAATKNDTVSVLLNNGDGTFLAGGVFATGGNRPTAIAAGDFDGVNGPDLAVTSRNTDALGNFSVSVLLNNGDATFAAAVNYTVGDSPQFVVVGDLDALNGLDLAVVNDRDDTVSILLNNGNGTFAAAVNYPAGSRPISLAIGDLDGDFDSDLAVVDSGTDSIRILRNNGDGSFVSAGDFAVGIGASSAVASDLDNDGDLDLGVANLGDIIVPGNTVSVLLNQGSATFAAETIFVTGVSPISITAGDFDQDGIADLATAHDLVAGIASVLTGQITRVSQDCNSNGIPDECDVPPSIPLADAGGNVSVCSNTPSVMVGGAPTASGGMLPYTYLWTGGGAAFLNDVTAANPIFDIVAAGLGTFQICVEVTDGNGCISQVSCADILVTIPITELVATVELSPTISTPTSPGTLTRCITFELFDCGGSSVVIQTEMIFTVTTGMPVISTATVTVPCGNYTCITARDTRHSLRRTDQDQFGIMPIIGSQYVADFTDRTSVGGDDDSLIGGNLNSDNFIDILDFGIYVNRFGMNLGSGNTLCTSVLLHADISGDGLVGSGDFSFIQINFLQGSEANCCGLSGRSVTERGPVTEISIDDLRNRGLEELSSADLDHNGKLDQLDIAAFLRDASRKNSRNVTAIKHEVIGRPDK